VAKVAAAGAVKQQGRQAARGAGADSPAEAA
jgi:hypothetical protein